MDVITERKDLGVSVSVGRGHPGRLLEASCTGLSTKENLWALVPSGQTWWRIGPKGVILSTFMVTHTSRVSFLLLKTSLKESSSKNPKPDSYCLKEAIPEPIHETPGPDPSPMSLLESEDGSQPSETPLPDHRRVVDAQKKTESSGGRTADEL